MLSAPAATQELKLHIADIRSSAVALQGIDASLDVSAGNDLWLRIAQVSIAGREWRDVSLRCPQVSLATDLIECRKGMLGIEGEVPITFSYRPREKDLQLALLPAPGERWEAHIRFRDGRIQTDFQVRNGALRRLNRWLDKNSPQFSAGAVVLDGVWKSEPRGRHAIEVRGVLDKVAFSDASGLHAGENIAGDFDAHAVFERQWTWRLNAAWRAGEVFWQPLYLTSAQRTLTAAGAWNGQEFTVNDARLSLDRIGTVQWSGVWNRARARLEHFVAEGMNLNLSAVYETVLKPLWSDRMAGHLAVTGNASGRIELNEGRVVSLDVETRDATVKDENGLFGLEGISISLPWRRLATGNARARVERGQLWGVPLGSFGIDAEFQRDSVRVVNVSIPVLDGALKVEGLNVSNGADGWRFQASAALLPVSMERLSEALKWPQMNGTLSAVVPNVGYDRQALSVGGAVLFKVFDGTAVITDLQVNDLLSRASRVRANVDMRGLDLDFLTRAFSFGSMQGRVDVSVKDLELSNWRPVRFDARVESSPGDYPKKISQRAVQNIASLGGAGAAVALQRSFLRFFEQFRYDRIGLSCRLEYNVCTMGGIGDAQDGYLIVRGGGIPALSVIGYNRHVGWSELLERLSRIRQGGAKPVVQ